VQSENYDTAAKLKKQIEELHVATQKAAEQFEAAKHFADQIATLEKKKLAAAAAENYEQAAKYKAEVEMMRGLGTDVTTDANADADEDADTNTDEPTELQPTESEPKPEPEAGPTESEAEAKTEPTPVDVDPPQATDTATDADADAHTDAHADSSTDLQMIPGKAEPVLPTDIAALVKTEVAQAAIKLKEEEVEEEAEEEEEEEATATKLQAETDAQEAARTSVGGSPGDESFSTPTPERRDDDEENKQAGTSRLVQQVVDAATPSKGTRDAFATATATAGRVLVAASGNIMEHFAVEVAVGVAKGAVSLATG
jgi:hypothetical protein